jgi:hypothetical protein
MRTLKPLAACFAIAHFMRWEIDAAVTLPIPGRESKIAQPAFVLIAGRTMLIFAARPAKLLL